MTLKPRTTYVSNDGKSIHIAGPTTHQYPWWPGAMWSIEGNHYTPDGRFIGTRVERVRGEECHVIQVSPDGRHYLDIKAEAPAGADDGWCGEADKSRRNSRPVGRSKITAAAAGQFETSV